MSISPAQSRSGPGHMRRVERRSVRHWLTLLNGVFLENFLNVVLLGHVVWLLRLIALDSDAGRLFEFCKSFIEKIVKSG